VPHQYRGVPVALKHLLPPFAGIRDLVDAGALMSYSAWQADLYRETAVCSWTRSSRGRKSRSSKPFSLASISHEYSHIGREDVGKVPGGAHSSGIRAL